MQIIFVLKTNVHFEDEINECESRESWLILKYNRNYLTFKAQVKRQNKVMAADEMWTK